MLFGYWNDHSFSLSLSLSLLTCANSWKLFGQNKDHNTTVALPSDLLLPEIFKGIYSTFIGSL